MAPPALILLTGLGGSCTRAPASFLMRLGLDASYARDCNEAYDTSGSFLPYWDRISSLVAAARSVDYSDDLYHVTRVDPAAYQQIKDRFETMLSKRACNHRLCLYKDEVLTFSLPLFRLMLRPKKRRMCVAITVRDPMAWTFSKQNAGLFRWGSALLDKNIHIAPDMYRSTINHTELRIKADLWAQVHSGLLQWSHRMHNARGVSVFVWRCKQDSAFSLIKPMLDQGCFRWRDVSNESGRMYFQERQVAAAFGQADASTASGEPWFLRVDTSDPELQATLDHIVSVTGPMAREWGVHQESGAPLTVDGIRALQQAHQAGGRQGSAHETAQPSGRQASAHETAQFSGQEASAYHTAQLKHMRLHERRVARSMQL